ncbi:MAG: hypothetical protein NVSMB4_02320 [Acidimicrobiales bacterium]
MSAQWPKVVNRLLTLLPTLPGWSGVTLFDGPPVTGDNPNLFATIGYVKDDQAGNYTSTQHDDGFNRHETGEVKCELVVNSGDPGLSGVRAQAFALMDALDASLRSDRRMGVLSPEGTSTLVVDVLSITDPAGTAQALTFAVHYTTVT